MILLRAALAALVLSCTPLVYAQDRLVCNKHEKLSYGGLRDTELTVQLKNGQPVSLSYRGYFNATGKMGDGHPCALDLQHGEAVSRWTTTGSTTQITFKPDDDSQDASQLTLTTDGKTLEAEFEVVNDFPYCGGDAEFPVQLRLDRRGKCTVTYARD